MEDKGELIYDEKTERNKKNIVSKRSRRQYLVFAVVFIGGSIFIGFYILFGLYSIDWPADILLLLALVIIIAFGFIALYNFLTIVDLKVYENGIVLPDKLAFSNEKFVSFRDMGALVLRRTSDKSWFLMLTKPGVAIGKDVGRNDQRVWGFIGKDSLCNLDEFLRVVKGRVKFQEERIHQLSKAK